MSFRGKPSKGCGRCRQRKIKCDETHPVCQRCSKGNHDCVYRSEFDIFLRNETTQTAEKAQRKWRSRAIVKPTFHSPPEDSASPEGASQSSKSEELSEISQVQLQPPSFSVITPRLAELAHKRFLFDFVVPADPQNGFTGFQTFLPSFYSRASPNSCFAIAFSATSLANFGARCHVVEAKQLAIGEYAKALRLLSQNLREGGNVETLAAISLMGIYELMTSPQLTEVSSWTAHTNGAVALLKICAQTEHSEEAIALFQSVLSQMLINRLTKGEAPSLPIELCDALVNPRSIKDLLLSKMYKAACLCAEWRNSQNDTTLGSEWLLSKSLTFLQEAQALDEELDSWMKSRPLHWQYTKSSRAEVAIPPWLHDLYNAPGAPDTFYKYTDYYIAHRWMFCRSTKLVLYQNMLGAIKIQLSAAESHDTLRDTANLQIDIEFRTLEVIKNICEATFSSLTLPLKDKPEAQAVSEVVGLRGYALLWPVYRAGMTFKGATSLQGLDLHGRSGWIRNVLMFFAESLGIDKAWGFLNNMDGKYGDRYP